jgi:ATP-dependent Clp protease ATP-binding subunit ClpA
MDQSGEDILAGMPPDLISTESPAAALSDECGDSVAPDIDVPFTPAAERVIDRCLELADLVGGSAVMTEHLLLAIASTPESAAAKLIAENDLSSEGLLAAMQVMLGADNSTLPANPTTPRLERVIIRAKREAYRHRHSEVSTLHLLMALIRERAGLAMLTLDRTANGYQRLANAPRHAAESD